MDERDKSILWRMAEYCRDIASFIERFGRDFSVFTLDRAYFHAVSMCILQIGELSGSLSEEYRAETAEKIPWTNIRGMRNIVAHDYGALDEELVWETALDDIPALLDFCVSEWERLNTTKNDR